ncbi:hypothetical protein DNTS_030129 [Danionella cerebrum]|uniref:Thyroglobulin type-1 domain-containing protein n=1 Tax=Danionella cerebrum TaxID=2873325 RepID=A0A553QMV1_9TELE|nr:hypothetical protein DNTS_030129 [Danionella translucida]
MDEQQNASLIERVPSAETISGGDGAHRRERGSSNARALKVTGLTILVCLLLAGQALTTYMVWSQREHLQSLSSSQEKLKAELTKKMSAGPPKAMRLPMNSMKMIDFSEQQTDPSSDTPKSVLQPVEQPAAFSLPGEGSELLRVTPKRMHIPMGFKLLEEKSSEEAVHEPKMNCQLESERQVKPGYYKPQCDEEGHFLPMQCWNSTGYCWCVKQDGTEIPGTRIRGRPRCGKGALYWGIDRIQLK